MSPADNHSIKVEDNLPEFESVQRKLLQYGKLTEYVFKPSDVRDIWASSRVKDELVKFFQELYKPASQYEQEKVEYNKINILSEYQLYNLTFCKNELMLDDFKTAAVLDIMWKLLEFDPDRGSRALLKSHVPS